MDEIALRREIVHTPVGDVLLSIEDAGGRAAFHTVVGVLDGEHSDATRVAGQLRELGLTDPNPKMSQNLNLTGLGRRMAQAVRTSRTSGEARTDKVGHALLAWLAAGGHPSSVAEFVGHPNATAYDVPFTSDEVQEASDYLTDERYIKSFDAWGLSSGLRPEITPQGRKALRTDVPLSQYFRGISGHSYDYSNRTTVTADNVGAVQTGGSNNVQNVTMTLTTDQRSHIVNEISDILRQLDEAGAEDSELLRDALQTVKSEAESGTQESVKDAVLAAVGAAAATQGTTFLLESLGMLAGMILG